MKKCVSLFIFILHVLTGLHVYAHTNVYNIEYDNDNKLLYVTIEKKYNYNTNEFENKYILKYSIKKSAKIEVEFSCYLESNPGLSEWIFKANDKIYIISKEENLDKLNDVIKLISKKIIIKKHRRFDKSLRDLNDSLKHKFNCFKNNNKKSEEKLLNFSRSLGEIYKIENKKITTIGLGVIFGKKDIIITTSNVANEIFTKYKKDKFFIRFSKKIGYQIISKKEPDIYSERSNEISIIKLEKKVNIDNLDLIKFHDENYYSLKDTLKNNDNILILCPETVDCDSIKCSYSYRINENNHNSFAIDSGKYDGSIIIGEIKNNSNSKNELAILGILKIDNSPNCISSNYISSFILKNLSVL